MVNCDLVLEPFSPIILQSCCSYLSSKQNIEFKKLKKQKEAVQNELSNSKEKDHRNPDGSEQPLI